MYLTNTMIKALLLLIGAMFSILVSANSIEFTVEHITTPSLNEKSSNAVLVPNQQHIFIYNQSGEISLYNRQSKQETVLVTRDQLAKSHIQLSALTLHPNFNTEKQKGYLTFYTAHVEKSTENARAIKLSIPEDDAFPLESVITVWQLVHTETGYSVKPASKREILRLPVPHISTAIKGLYFNHHIKYWQKGFASLFILTGFHHEYADHPLFSGALLRITPEKFGLKQYTIPMDNHLDNSDKIPQEIVATGLGDVNHLTWLKENEHQFIFVANNVDKTQITTATFGSNYLKKTSKTLNKNDNEDIFSNIIYTRSQRLNNEHYPIIYVEKSSKEWHVKASALSSTISNVVATISFNTLNKNASPIIFVDLFKNIALLDPVNQVILKQKMPQSADFSDVKSNTTNNKAQTYILVLMLLVALGFATFLFRQDEKYKGSKKILRSHFATFAIDKKNGTFLAFKRHEKSASETINIKDIVRSVIFLNDEVITEVSLDLPFSNQAESDMSKIFKQEKRHKMIDDKLRKVTMDIHLQSGDSKSLCLYLREGNQRLTKARFEQIQAQITDWCWLLSHQLCADKTEKRVIKTKPQQAEQPTKKSVSSSHAGVDKSSTPQAKPVASRPGNTQSVTPNSVDKHRQEKSHNQESDETLINSLNKLIELKAQGFLSEEEFKRSKARILEKLSGD